MPFFLLTTPAARAQGHYNVKGGHLIPCVCEQGGGKCECKSFDMAFQSASGKWSIGGNSFALLKHHSSPAEVEEAWRETVENDRKISSYLHVPFSPGAKGKIVCSGCGVGSDDDEKSIFARPKAEARRWGSKIAEVIAPIVTVSLDIANDPIRRNMPAVGAIVEGYFGTYRDGIEKLRGLPALLGGIHGGAMNSITGNMDDITNSLEQAQRSAAAAATGIGHQIESEHPVVPVTEPPAMGNGPEERLQQSLTPRYDGEPWDGNKGRYVESVLLENGRITIRNYVSLHSNTPYAETYCEAHSLSADELVLTSHADNWYISIPLSSPSNANIVGKYTFHYTSTSSGSSDVHFFSLILPLNLDARHREAILSDLKKYIKGEKDPAPVAAPAKPAAPAANTAQLKALQQKFNQLASLLAALPKASSEVSNVAKAPAPLRILLYRQMDALENKDMVAFAKTVAPDAGFLNAKGELVSRAQWLGQQAAALDGLKEPAVSVRYGYSESANAVPGAAGKGDTILTGMRTLSEGANEADSSPVLIQNVRDTWSPSSSGYFLKASEVISEPVNHIDRTPATPVIPRISVANMTDQIAKADQGLRANYTAQTLVVSHGGDGQYTSINAAIQAATEKTLILVKPGIYDEAVVVDKNVALVADGAAGEVVIQTGLGSCVEMKTDDGAIFGFTLKSQSVASGAALTALLMTTGHPFVFNCDLTSNTHFGMILSGGGAAPIIRYCTIHDSAKSDVWVGNAARPIFEDCVMSGAAAAGVNVGESNSGPTFRRCGIYNNKGCGIQADAAVANITISSCDIAHNSAAGLLFWHGAGGSVDNTRIHDNTAFGIYVMNSAPFVSDCDIYGNSGNRKCPGVFVNANANPTFRRCTIHSNPQEGIQCDGAHGSFDECRIYSNGTSGIVIMRDSDTSFSKCASFGNKSAGVAVFGSSAGTVTECDLTGNGYGPKYIPDGAKTTFTNNQP